MVVWTIAAAVLLGKVVRFLKERSRMNMIGRWVVVTGCDSGIGAGVVATLVAEGAAVIACVYTADGAERMKQTGAQHVLRFDVTDAAAIESAAARIDEATGGSLWGIVHNAGMVLPGFVEYQLIETYRRVMEVNCFAAVQLTQPLIPMLKRSNGRVVIVSSVDGIVSLPGNAPYDASKFAVEAYADALRVELSFWNVHVAVVNPSTMKTPLAMGFFEAHKQAWEMMDERDPAGAWKKTWTRAWLDEFISANSRNLASMAQDPVHAVRDVVHAVVARSPRMRYLSGTLAKTLFFALWKMPERWAFVAKRATIAPRPMIEP
jgi:NAD(P)-dependent dehydrogenase (short-subunit alcohol dehydrogenase family)